MSGFSQESEVCDGDGLLITRGRPINLCCKETVDLVNSEIMMLASSLIIVHVLILQYVTPGS